MANGHQYVAYSVVALLERKVTCPSLWTTSSLVCILALGDKLYVNISKGGKNTCLLTTFQAMFHGLLNGETNITFCSLYDAFDNLFSKPKKCIHTIENSERYNTSAKFMCEHRFSLTRTAEVMFA
jgi:hypothetical protein